MAGGKGERFWPLSTATHPKQVLTLFGGKPLIAMAVDYVDGFIPPERVLVITNQSLVDPIHEALPNVPIGNIIGEPFGRDTAAAVALAAAIIGARDPDAVFCILTADHIIDDIDIFCQTLRDGCRLALQSDLLLTIGIATTFPSTGFGYIEASAPVEFDGQTKFLRAKRFVEKPDLATAREYVEDGNYSWNYGMFIWSVKSLNKALGAHAPKLLAMGQRMTEVVDTPEFAPRLVEEYGMLEKISVDYALMEKADNIVMARGVFEWNDVGCWSSVENHFEPDPSGNIIVGDCQSVDSSDNIVVSPDRLTAILGVEGLVVVQGKAATLICPKNRAQDVKLMVKLLEENGGYQTLL